MAKVENGGVGLLNGSTISSGDFDPLDDNLAFEDSLNMDDEPVFLKEDWNLPNSPPYDRGLYSTPLSWDPPKTRAPVEEPVIPTFPTIANTLTPAQQERLRNIAMPDRFQYQSQDSPQSASSTYKSGSVSSPDQDNNRKRKSSEEGEDDDDDGDGSSHPPVKKTAHNMIEKRYRTNLNDKIAALRDSVPSLRVMTKNARGEDGEKEDLQGLTPAHKLNKATVLAKATEYIRHLEKRNTRLTDENTAMKARISAFEKLFMAGSMGMQTMPPSNPYPYMQDPYMTSPNNGQMTPGLSPQGMIDIPEDFRRLHAANQMNQQTYQVPQENYQAPNRGPIAQNGWQNPGFFGKMMVGSLAGLMILEGFSEREQSSEEPNARGLFAVPTQVLTTVAQYLRSSTDIRMLGYHVSLTEIFSFFKLLFMVGALLYVFVPSFFAKKPKPKDLKAPSSPSLSAAPSPASSIRVRRQAWLTAIQTVWVPRHNFFLEAAALFLKMLKLSVRNAIGWPGYSLLTGTTEQDEEARIKAWEIALDAQLAGGDMEINMSRLTLTLVASGTLPDTPARLMLKAVHIRVLLWELGNSGFNGFYMFQEIAAKLARWKWNEARQLQKILSHPHANSPESVEPLPSHLVALLEQECDEVLVDSVGQRAYNLAFNLPTNRNAIRSSEGMDGVVDDYSIRSPLDAVAAWYSSLVLDKALAESLSDDGDQESIEGNVELAIRTAPSGSSVELRALVARAILYDEKRGAYIAAALQALDKAEESSDDGKDDSKPSSTLVNTSTSLSSLPDLQTSLDCATAIAHLKRTVSLHSPTAAYNVINSIRPSKLSLLGFVAAYKLVQAINEDETASSACSRSLEGLAGNLRIWIGGPEATKSGLNKNVKEKVIETCISITKKLIGMEKDAGYESMSDDEGEGC